MNEISECSSCKYVLQSAWYFCPNCGKQFKESPLVISIPKQIVIYGVSFFLAPFGLSWGLKYVRSKDRKVKIVGIISIVLTILSVTLLIVSFKYVMDQYAATLNSLTNGQNY